MQDRLGIPFSPLHGILRLTKISLDHLADADAKAAHQLIPDLARAHKNNEQTPSRTPENLSIGETKYEALNSEPFAKASSRQSCTDFFFIRHKNNNNEMEPI